VPDYDRLSQSLPPIRSGRIDHAIKEGNLQKNRPTLGRKTTKKVRSCMATFQMEQNRPS